MTDTYLPDCHKISANKPPPERSNCEIGEDPASRQTQTLWDIATPEEVAHTILEFYPYPLEEFSRRQKGALKIKHAENIRFWNSVRQVMETVGPSWTGVVMKTYVLSKKPSPPSLKGLPRENR